MSRPLDEFLARVVSDCVNGSSGSFYRASSSVPVRHGAGGIPQEEAPEPDTTSGTREDVEMAPGREPDAPGPVPCPECAGSGVIWVHVCRTGAECAKRCPQQQQCMGCLGSGIR